MGVSDLLLVSLWVSDPYEFSGAFTKRSADHGARVNCVLHFFPIVLLATSSSDLKCGFCVQHIIWVSPCLTFLLVFLFLPPFGLFEHFPMFRFNFSTLVIF